MKLVIKMTKKLYEENPYQTTFDAQVLSCTKKDDKYDILLDQTLFFPCEGGQTCDQGTLNDVDVIDVQILDDTIHHYTNKPLSGIVQGRIDWKHRYNNMQNHTGEHILSGIIHKYYHVENVGFHLGHHEITTDYASTFTPSQIQDIEEKVNQVILENKKVKAYYLKDYSHIQYRAKLDLEKPRLVEIEDVDLCACCAPHVQSTAEVGVFKILKTMKIKKGTRFFFLCGHLAYQDYVLKHDQTTQISNLLSAPTNKLSSATNRLLEENQQLKLQISHLHKQIIDTIPLQVKENQIVLTDTMDRETQLYYFNTLLKYSKNYVLLVSKQEKEYRFMTNSKEIFEVLKEKHQVRGGGKNDFFQGSLDTVNEQLFD